MHTQRYLRRAVSDPLYGTLFRNRTTPATSVSLGFAKSFDEMPEKKHMFGLIGSMFKFYKNKDCLHEVWREHARKLGPVYKEVIGPITQVHVNSAVAMEDAFRHLDKWPQKPYYVHLPWQEYRKISGESYALLTAENEEWHKYRHALSDKMLKRDILTNYDTEVNNIITDLLDRLTVIRDKDDMTIPLLTNEFYKWAMETVCSFLFEKRLGTLNDPVPQMSQDFINAVGEMLHSTFYLGIFTDFHVKWNTKSWRQHSGAWAKVFEVARFYLDEKLNELTEQHKQGNIEDSPKTGAFLTRLIASEQLTFKEIYANVSEIMLAGVDTTSNTMCFTLCLLANYPDVQKKLQQEVDSVLGGRIPTGDELSNLPYLKMVIKESMRLSPVVPVHARCASQDIEIGGYNVPAMTSLMLHTYCASTDPDFIDDPEEFRPERWDRTNASLPHPFASLPFSFGQRGCIGRRLAELELHMILARITQRFDIQPSDRYQLKPVYRAVLTPGDNLPLKFIDRK